MNQPPPSYSELITRWIKVFDEPFPSLLEKNLDAHYMHAYSKGAKGMADNSFNQWGLKVIEVRKIGWKDGYGDYH
jgi:hypothetical protein